MGLHWVAVVIGLVGLGFELVEKGGYGVVLTLDEGGTVLPNAVFRPPLATSWVALILMDVVHAEVIGERFAEDVQSFWLLQQGFEVG